jgi:hypothetical protein
MAVLPRLLLPTAICALTTALAGCATRMAASAINLAPPEPAAPVSVRRPIDAALACFGTGHSARRGVSTPDRSAALTRIASAGCARQWAV